MKLRSITLRDPWDRRLLWIESILLVCTLALTEQARIHPSWIQDDSHLSGTSQTVLFSSTLWKPDFMALTSGCQRQVEFSPTAPTRPTKYNSTGPSWLDWGTHGTPRLEKPSRSQAWLGGTERRPLAGSYSSRSAFRLFIAMNPRCFRGEDR